MSSVRARSPASFPRRCPSVTAVAKPRHGRHLRRTYARFPKPSKSCPFCQRLTLIAWRGRAYVEGLVQGKVEHRAPESMARSARGGARGALGRGPCGRPAVWVRLKRGTATSPHDARTGLPPKSALTELTEGSTPVGARRAFLQNGTDRTDKRGCQRRVVETGGLGIRPPAPLAAALAGRDPLGLLATSPPAYAEALVQAVACPVVSFVRLGSAASAPTTSSSLGSV